MTSPVLETIANSMNYTELPENWRCSIDAETFSDQKSLYDYQRHAMESAAKALYFYFKGGNTQKVNTNVTDTTRHLKDNLYRKYVEHHIDILDIPRYESQSDKRKGKENSVFQILSNYFPPEKDKIQFKHLINRMGFWMATGSGKTIVMIKLIELMHRLMQRNEIPKRKFLILAPSDHLLNQIKETVQEFNRKGLFLNLVPITKISKAQQSMFGDVATVYYHRSDNISNVQKEALVNFERYESDGNWYVFLDEAHKGNKEDSKRQAYYTVMSKEGFLFNFSATFTDAHDIVTTVKKFNLEEFVGEGYGKRIFLNRDEFDAFSRRKLELNYTERRKVVLMSLLNLALVIVCVKKIRERTGIENLYHSPLMLTLVNSVNTSVEKQENDLWAFFETLRDVATGTFDANLFATVKDDLITNWKTSHYVFGSDGFDGLGEIRDYINDFTIGDLCEHIFLSREHGALQIIRSKDNKEIAIQMKNADAPFGLIRIGQTAKWRTQLLHNYEETLTLKDSSYFSKLEKSSITILMGSRSFFESWDSNRPNVINFINIGGVAAKKFVVQSVGRGVRIEPIPSSRRRHNFLPASNYFDEVRNLTLPIETLFLYATNRNAIRTVLEGLQSEKSGKFEIIEGFRKADVQKLNGNDMTLLVPQYREEASEATEDYAKFTMSNSTYNRFRQYLETTSDAVFLIRDGLLPTTLTRLRKFIHSRSEKIKESASKDYGDLNLLLFRLVSYMDSVKNLSDGVRELDEEMDIVHFRQIRTRLTLQEANELTKKVMRVAQGSLSEEDLKELAHQFSTGKITTEEFQSKIQGESISEFKNLTIQHIKKHYYLPVILSDSNNSDFIRHIINEESEVTFMKGLESWLEDNEPNWDAWMFSKIDEYLDKIYIPYYNSETNEYAKFMPDFIFWMCKGSNFQITFVDPKGTVHKSAYLKIDGFIHFFESRDGPVKFNHKNWNVHAKLLMFNEDQDVPNLYRRFWSSDYRNIFN